MTKKLLLFMCILINLGCMMMAALLFSLRNQGLGIFTDGMGIGQSIDFTTAIVVLLVLAAVSMIAVVKLAVSMRKK